MGIFKSKEDKMQELIEQFELNRLSEKDFELAKRAMSYFNLAVMSGPMTVTANGADTVKTSDLNAIVCQNWLIIKQLDRLNSNIEKLLNKNDRC